MLGKKSVAVYALVIMLSAVLLSSACGGGGGSTIGNPITVTKTDTPVANLVHIGWGAQTGLNIWGDPGAVEANSMVTIEAPSLICEQVQAGADGSFSQSIDLTKLQTAVGETLLVTTQSTGKDDSDPVPVVIPPM